VACRLSGLREVSVRPGSGSVGAVLDSSLTLADGRSIAYTDLGPSSSPVVMYFHGAPSTRMRVPAQRDVVTEPRRLLVRVGMTAKPREQSDVVDNRPLGLVEADILGDPQAKHARAQDVLHRLANPEVVASDSEATSSASRTWDG
jgi:hypothetical protein